jgi:hypothetical protein
MLYWTLSTPAPTNYIYLKKTYSNGLSEVILGKAIKQHKLPRDEIVVLTKVFFIVGHEPSVAGVKNPDQNGYVNQHGLSRKHIFDSVKKSLERLQLDYIDVLQCKSSPHSNLFHIRWSNMFRSPLWSRHAHRGDSTHLCTLYWINTLTFAPHRCKLYMTSSKLAGFDTSACPPVMPGNVRLLAGAISFRLMMYFCSLRHAKYAFCHFCV